MLVHGNQCREVKAAWRGQGVASMAGAAGGDFLAVFVPGVNPTALAAGEGITRGIEDLAHIAHAEGV